MDDLHTTVPQKVVGRWGDLGTGADLYLLVGITETAGQQLCSHYGIIDSDHDSVGGLPHAWGSRFSMVS